eukprot:scaffold228978_cov66-Cyclotella_meneghiniana.AAC.5
MKYEKEVQVEGRYFLMLKWSVVKCNSVVGPSLVVELQSGLESSLCSFHHHPAGHWMHVWGDQKASNSLALGTGICSEYHA